MGIPKIKIYAAQKMTGRFCDDMRQEAEMLVRVLTNYGFEILSPVIEEAIPYEHVELGQMNAGRLEHFWHRDKEMIQEADVILDYMSCNESDGVNTEVGYARYCLWKPVIRIWPKVYINISKIEHDLICDNLIDALLALQMRWGTYEKLRIWRVEMLARSLPNWLAYQQQMNQRYGIERRFEVL